MLVPPWAYALAAASAIGGGFYAGWKVQGWRCEAARAEALEDAAKALRKAENDLLALSTQYEQERADAQANDYLRQDAVRTIFRDRPVAAGCAAPDDARRVLEQGVAEANARAAGEPVAALPNAPVAAVAPR